MKQLTAWRFKPDRHHQGEAVLTWTRRAKSEKRMAKIVGAIASLGFHGKVTQIS